jgi:hypothetical protein
MVTENIATTNLAFGKYLENFLFKPKFCKNKPYSPIVRIIPQQNKPT